MNQSESKKYMIQVLESKRNYYIAKQMGEKELVYCLLLVHAADSKVRSPQNSFRNLTSLDDLTWNRRIRYLKP